MSQSLAKILLHVVFSTKERRPLLRERAFREEMHHYIGGILKGLETLRTDLRRGVCVGLMQPFQGCAHLADQTQDSS